MVEHGSKSKSKSKTFPKRLIGICLFGGLLILAAVGYQRYFLARPIGTGPAGPLVAGEPFQDVWTDRPVMLVGLGDSITAGLGARTPEHTFFNRLIRNPSDEFSDIDGLCLANVLPNLNTLNLAISGSTSKIHLDVINQRLDTYPDNIFGIVVMTTGGNDLIHSYGKSPAKECAMYATCNVYGAWFPLSAILARYLCRGRSALLVLRQH